MPKVAVIAAIEAQPGKRGALLAALIAHRNRCRRDEAGVTLAIDIIVPRGGETQLLVHEVYRDEAAFEEHRNNPSLAQFREDTAGLIAKFEPTWGTPVD